MTEGVYQAAASYAAFEEAAAAAAAAATPPQGIARSPSLPSLITSRVGRLLLERVRRSRSNQQLASSATTAVPVAAAGSDTISHPADATVAASGDSGDGGGLAPLLVALSPPLPLPPRSPPLATVIECPEAECSFASVAAGLSDLGSTSTSTYTPPSTAFTSSLIFHDGDPAATAAAASALQGDGPLAAASAATRSAGLDRGFASCCRRSMGGIGSGAVTGLAVDELAGLAAGDALPNLQPPRQEQPPPPPLRLVVVANRLPVTCAKDARGAWQLKASSGGLVSALRGVRGGYETTWIGWPGVWVPPGAERNELAAVLKREGYEPVWVEEDLLDLFYNGFCNSVLWQLFHYTPPSLETFQQAAEQRTLPPQWAAYQAANELFAAAVLSFCEGDQQGGSRRRHQPNRPQHHQPQHSHPHHHHHQQPHGHHQHQQRRHSQQHHQQHQHDNHNHNHHNHDQQQHDNDLDDDDSPVVWIQDYHLMVLPQLLKQRMPRLKVGFFLHTPFPSSEVYRSLPLREQILRGVLAADLVGFQTYDYARHFISACMRILGLEGTPEGVEDNGQLTRVGTFPIGIETDRFTAALDCPEVVAQVAALRTRFSGRKVILGVDRLDMVKGIPHKLLAFEKLLEEQPRWRDKALMVQIAVPSRTDVLEYQQLRSRVHEIVGRVNGRYGSLTHVPVHHLDTSLSFAQLVALYAASDVGLVTSLRDGMNLVSYEYVACQGSGEEEEEEVGEDGHERNEQWQQQQQLGRVPGGRLPGVLVLSEFAGAAQSLGSGALLVNPWDVVDVASALHHALTMSDDERRERHRYNFKHVQTHTAQHWADTFITELLDTRIEARLRARHVPPQLDVREVARAYSRSTRRRLLVLGYSALLTSSSSATAGGGGGSSGRSRGSGAAAQQNVASTVVRRELPGARGLARIDPRVMAALKQLCADRANTLVFISGCDTAKMDGLLGGLLDGGSGDGKGGGGSGGNGAGGGAAAVWLVAENGMFVRPLVQRRQQQHQQHGEEAAVGSASGRADTVADGEPLADSGGLTEWRPLLEQLPCLPSLGGGVGCWLGAVRLVLDYFAERTPGSFVEARATSLVWNYKHTDPEFGRLQARDLLQHLRAGPISKAPVEISTTGRSVEVRPAGVSKGLAMQHLLRMFNSSSSSNGGGGNGDDGGGGGSNSPDGASAASSTANSHWKADAGAACDRAGGGGGVHRTDDIGGVGRGRDGGRGGGRDSGLLSGFDLVLCMCGHLSPHDEDIYTVIAPPPPSPLAQEHQQQDGCSSSSGSGGGGGGGSSSTGSLPSPFTWARVPSINIPPSPAPPYVFTAAVGRGPSKAAFSVQGCGAEVGALLQRLAAISSGSGGAGGDSSSSSMTSRQDCAGASSGPTAAEAKLLRPAGAAAGAAATQHPSSSCQLQLHKQRRQQQGSGFGGSRQHLMTPATTLLPRLPSPAGAVRSGGVWSGGSSGVGASSSVGLGSGPDGMLRSSGHLHGSSGTLSGMEVSRLESVYSTDPLALDWLLLSAGAASPVTDWDARPPPPAGPPPPPPSGTNTAGFNATLRGSGAAAGDAPAAWEPCALRILHPPESAAAAAAAAVAAAGPAAAEAAEEDGGLPHPPTPPRSHRGL